MKLLVILFLLKLYARINIFSLILQRQRMHPIFMIDTLKSLTQATQFYD